MNATQLQCEPHDPVVLIKYEHRSAGGSWEEPVSTVRNSTFRRSQRFNSTLDSRTSGQFRNTISRARVLCEKFRIGAASGGTTPPAPPPEDEGGGKLGRWFSLRGRSTHQYDMQGQDPDKMPKLPEVEEDLFSNGGDLRAGRIPPPSLGPPPDTLTAEQLRRRHVVAAIIHSENSYVATLQRLVNDYKKPLEESSPAILNASKIQTLFHRLPDILQCHLHFRAALTDCSRTWDRDEKIGEVFQNAFSKAVVLDVYSDFINNFSVAMELAKMESKRKSALADFFKVKQISAHDRLSFFGLMVKPVQRFPQFIMFLQDLLKHTPPGHSDRVSLQRALTRLEALADALNERKRDAERTQAFRAALRRLTRSGVAGAGGAGGAARFGAARLLASKADRRHLLRQDDLVQLEFNASGAVSKCKPRRLLLLNDLVVCVSVTTSDTERIALKWAAPVQDVEVADAGSSPTLCRVLQGMNRSGSMRSTSSQWSSSTGDSLCTEMSALMHDYETVSRMADLANSLHEQYDQITPDVFKTLLQNIQKSIQKKDDEMAWVDSCCLQLTVRGREEPLTFRASEPGARLAWATELRLAQLASASANTPAWRLAGTHSSPPHKMPLFVAAQPVFSSKNLTEVRCGCFYSCSGGSRRARQLLWTGTGGATGHVAVFLLRAARLKLLATLDLPEVQVTSMEYAKGIRQTTTLCGDTVWLGTNDKKILIFSALEPEKQEKLAEAPTVAAVTHIKYHCDAMFVGLANGRISVFRRRNADDSWALQEPLAIELGDEPVHCVLPVDGIVYATCGRKIFAINGMTSEIIRILELEDEGNRNVRYLAHSGVGLWTAFADSTYVSLYHAETFEHLQNIDIAADVARTIGARDGTKPAFVSALLASQGLLWVGTSAGVSVTVPLPKLEGLPLLGGPCAVGYHAHAGPVSFLLPLLSDRSEPRRPPIRSESTPEEDERPKLERRPSEEAARPQRALSAVVRRRRPLDARLSRTLPKCANLTACDVYGLYGDLMFVKDCANESDVSGSGGEALRRSDPELAAIPFRVNTLDRRLKMRAGRPRSLELSSWSVDSRASSLCTSSGSEESMALRGISRTGSGVGVTSTPVSRSNSGSKPSAASGSGAGRSLKGADFVGGEARRSVVVVSGGRGYVDWRQTAEAEHRPAVAADPNPKDAHLVLWEMRLL